MGLSRFGGDLLSHVLRRSTIGAAALNGRVRNGAGCFARAMTTKPGKTHACILVQVFFQHCCPGQVHLVFVMYAYGSGTVLLFLDRIKPIGPLVPVS